MGCGLCFKWMLLTDGWRIDWGEGQEYDQRGKFRRPLTIVLIKD